MVIIVDQENAALGEIGNRKGFAGLTEAEGDLEEELGARAALKVGDGVAEGAVQIDMASHEGGELAGNGEAEAGAPVLAADGIIDLGKLLKELVLFFRGNADARIADGKGQPNGIGSVGEWEGVYLKEDLAGLGKFNGISDQVDEDLAQACGIADEGIGQIGLAGKDEFELLFLGGLEAMDGSQFVEERVELERDGFEAEFSGFNFGKVEDIVEEDEEGIGGAFDVGGVAVLLRVEAGFEEEFGHADDAIHGRPDFVAHIGEELTLGDIGGLGAFGGVAELILGDAPHVDIDEEFGEYGEEAVFVRCILVMLVYGVEPDEPDRPAILQEGQSEETFNTLGFEDIPESGGRECPDIGNEHWFAPAVDFDPIGNHGKRDILEVLDLGFNALGAPLVGIGASLLIEIVVKNVAPVGTNEAAHFSEGFLEGILELIEGHIDVGSGNFGEEFLKLSLALQFEFGLFAVGDIGMGAGHADGDALLVKDGLTAGMDPPVRAIAVAHPEVDFVAFAGAFEVSLDIIHDGGGILRVEEFLKRIEGIGDLMILVAQLFFPFGGEVEAILPQVPVPDTVIGPANGEAELFATGLEFQLGAFEVGDFADGAGDAGFGAGGVGEGGGAEVEPACFVAVLDGVLATLGLCGFAAGGQGLEDERAGRFGKSDFGERASKDLIGVHVPACGIGNMEGFDDQVVIEDKDEVLHTFEDGAEALCGGAGDFAEKERGGFAEVG